MINMTEGGVTAPKGYKASGVACGLKDEGIKDLAIVCSDDIAVAAGVFTKNIVKGHSLELSMKLIKWICQGSIVNSGNANACLGEQGTKNAEEMADLAAHLLGCQRENILLGSTGVVGASLNLPKVREELNGNFFFIC